MQSKKLVVESVTQQAIFEMELKGQLSDGHWENASPRNHWEPWSDAEVVVAQNGEALGREFYARRDRYDYNSKKLREVVSGRMIAYARLARAGFTLAEISVLEYAIDGFTEMQVPTTFAIPEWVVKYATDEKDTASKRHYGEVLAKLNAFVPAVVEAALQDTSYGQPELKRDLKRLGEIVKMDRRSALRAAQLEGKKEADRALAGALNLAGMGFDRYTHHYVAGDDGWFLLWKNEKCESCGRDVMAANSMNVKIQPAVLDEMGMKFKMGRGLEAWHSDVVGREVCEICCTQEEAVMSDDPLSIMQSIL